MMMAKKPSHRYKNCRDLLLDLRALKAGDAPPIAHKGISELSGLETLAAAEAAAVSGEIPVDAREAARKSVLDIFSEPLFLVLLILLGVSIIANVVQIAI